jgi:hypothetical protein
MMMRMLEAGGLEPVVDNLRTADVDNPLGYYELEKVKQIHKDSSWLAGTQGKVFKMVSMLLTKLPSEYEYDIVFMKREMPEILASQAKMLQRLGKGGGNVDDPQMAALFAKHLAEIQVWLAQQKNMRVLYVNYRDAISDPAGTASHLSQFVGRPMDAGKMAAVVEKSLYRNRV